MDQRVWHKADEGRAGIIIGYHIGRVGEIRYDVRWSPGFPDTLESTATLSAIKEYLPSLN